MSADKDIDQFVFDYINDSLKYAIAIVGPWGSGKTRYIEQHLRIELRNKGYQLLRVSLLPYLILKKMLVVIAPIKSGRALSSMSKPL